MKTNPWKQIEISKDDYKTLRVNSAHLLDFFWGKDPKGNYLFIYEYEPNSTLSQKNIPELEGINISHENINNKSQLIFSLENKNHWEIFYHLCTNLMYATNDITIEKKAPNIILNRLKMWHKFLKRKKSDILTEEQIKGLIGELLFLKDKIIPKYGSENGIKFWIGPEDAPQDFVVKMNAIEVKCQIGSTNPRVKISSENQLYSQLSHLFLYVATLTKSPLSEKSINLPKLVNEIEQLFENPLSDGFRRFEDLLFQIGYEFNEKYNEFNYMFVEEQIFNVKEGFPRIIPEYYLTGVNRVSYNINLLDCKDFKLDLKDWKFND